MYPVPFGYSGQTAHEVQPVCLRCKAAERGNTEPLYVPSSDSSQGWKGNRLPSVRAFHRGSQRECPGTVLLTKGGVPVNTSTPGIPDRHAELEKDLLRMCQHFKATSEAQGEPSSAQDAIQNTLGGVLSIVQFYWFGLMPGSI